MCRSVLASVCAYALLASACAKQAPPPPPAAAPAPQPAPARAPVEIEMKNVRLHLDEGIVLDIRSLRGEMVSTVAGQSPVMDDPRSYRIRVKVAEASIDMASLGNLLNRQVFAYEGAPLKELVVRTTSDGRLEQKGKLHKGVDVPFSMKASVAATSNGRMRLHAESVRALGVPAKGLMDLFGLKLEDVVNLKQRHGIEVEEDDVVIAPGQVLPPPQIEGFLSRVSVAGDRLLQTFSPTDGRQAAPLAPPDPKARNYVYFSGSELRFGKLTMRDADLQLIDADEKDPFDFFPARYEVQLVAGYSKSTARGGLKTFMPDYGDVGQPGAKDPF